MLYEGKEMDRYEEAVLDYITADRNRFISPQFHVPYEMQQGGSDPDFLVIDYRKKTIYVVEVTSSSNISGLIAKVEQRESRWLEPIKRHLSGINKEFEQWPYRVTIFVREENLELAKKKMKLYKDVSVRTIESSTFPYKWQWNGEEPINPLE